LRRVPDILRKRTLAMWLAGDSYRVIQRACDVSLATINMVKEEAKKETPDLEDLRTLNILLRKSNVNFYDTFRGANLLDRLNECGASLDDLGNFIKLVETQFSEKNGRTEEIIAASIRLMNLEEKMGKHYPELVKEFHKLSSKIPRLRSQIKRLNEEKKSKDAENADLDKRRVRLQEENRILLDEKNYLLGSTSSLASIALVLKQGVLPIPCNYCQSPLPMKLPGKKEYATLVHSRSCYNVRCQRCRRISLVPAEEITKRIGWTLLPPDDALIPI